MTSRLVDNLGTLRASGPYHAVRAAMGGMLRRTDFGIVHISLERDHMHLIAEAHDAMALGNGMRAFQSSAARRLNRTLGRRGRVFEDRYHSVAVTSPRQARRAMNYVLNNFRRHQLDDGMETRFWEVDYFSNGPTFDGWREGMVDLPHGYRPLPVARARTWLLRVGWRKAGSISQRAMPGR